LYALLASISMTLVGGLPGKLPGKHFSCLPVTAILHMLFYSLTLWPDDDDDDNDDEIQDWTIVL